MFFLLLRTPFLPMATRIRMGQMESLRILGLANLKMWVICGTSNRAMRIRVWKCSHMFTKKLIIMVGIPGQHRKESMLMIMRLLWLIILPMLLLLL
jgi:hypothetical protein